MENIQTNQQEKPKFSIPSDLVELPSKGIFYPNKPANVLIEFMTSKDEDILTSPNLLESGEVLNVLIKNKLRNKELDPNKLLRGDKNAILLFLRKSSYGSEYPVTVTDPKTNQPFNTIVDLELLKMKYMPDNVSPDERMEFSFTLPLSKKPIKFKFLTSVEEDEVIERSDAIQREFNLSHSSYITERLKRQIMDIDGNRDKMYISQFIDHMIAGDSLAFRTYVEKIEPNIDLSYEFTSPSNQKFRGTVALTTKFFYPNS